MSEKQQFLDAWGRECPTTLKLLKAYPAAKADLKPHERCRSAKELAWTFVFEGGAERPPRWAAGGGGGGGVGWTEKGGWLGPGDAFLFRTLTGPAVFPALPPPRRWPIVLARDRRFDGAFVYAVRSTGIYCRPTCPSRRPRRELVTFFPIPEAAEQAGFRPCPRCRPTSVNGAHPDVALVRHTCPRPHSPPDRPA